MGGGCGHAGVQARARGYSLMFTWFSLVIPVEWSAASVGLMFFTVLFSTH